MTVYHYTSINTLFHILNGIEHKEAPGADLDKIEYYFLKFHASNAVFLNDPTENTLYIEALLKAFGNDNMLKSAISVSNLLIGAPYALSFSELGDDLNMWRNYADNAQGVTLGLELDSNINTVIKERSSHVDNIQFGKCKYLTQEDIVQSIKKQADYKEIKERLKDACEGERIRIDNILRTILENCFFYKDVAYQAEKEWRLTVFGHFDCMFKNRKNKIIDYKEVVVPLSALKQIVFAPLTDFEKLNYSVRKMINEKIGSIRTDIEILKSKIPYSG